MRWPRLRHIAIVVPLVTLGGCQMVGAAGSMAGSLLSAAIYLAAIAAPILLGYYLYHRHIL